MEVKINTKSPKRWVVSYKTSACFHQNDVLFSPIRRVVFYEYSEVGKLQSETQIKSQDSKM